jgi:hypothetical protein
MLVRKDTSIYLTREQDYIVKNTRESRRFQSAIDMRISRVRRLEYQLKVHGRVRGSGTAL